jgi:cell division septal protein FtsQ
MFFSRRVKNRRGRQEQVLEVKARAAKVRAARWRLAVAAFGISMLLVGGGLLLLRVGQWGMRCLVFENESFAIRSFEVQTDGVLSAQQLRLWSGVKVGDNLLAVDLAQVKRNLELMPLIKSAAVERVLPQTLRLRVVEREPMVQALVLAPRVQGEGFDFETFYLDDEGYVMMPSSTMARPSAANANNEMLPVFWGLNIADLRPGRRVDLSQVSAALRLVELYEESPLLGVVDMARIDVSQPEILTVTTGQGAEVTLSITNLDTQLRRWRQAYDHGQKLGKVIATLDLSITNNLPATWVEASAAPPAKPKMIKISRTKKKHV